MQNPTWSRALDRTGLRSELRSQEVDSGGPCRTSGERRSAGDFERQRSGRCSGLEAQQRMRCTSDMQRWEYMTFDLVKRKKEIDELNRLGQEGWEAVAMVSSWESAGGSCTPSCFSSGRDRMTLRDHPGERPASNASARESADSRRGAKPTAAHLGGSRGWRRKQSELHASPASAGRGIARPSRWSPLGSLPYEVPASRTARAE